MINIISPHANVPLPPIERALFVLRPWLPTDSDGITETRRRLLEYRANPRSVEYMLDRAEEFKTQYATNAITDVLVERDASVPEKHRTWIRQVQVAGSRLSGYDAVIFLYPDAIGLGWDATEQSLRQLNTRQYLVINGRRRIFVWDDASRRALAWRRLLYRVSFLELLFAPVMFIAASWFALSDALTRRAQR